MFGHAHVRPHIERMGWDPMCNYSYLSGACANRRVNSLQCVGEDECEFSDMNILGHPLGKDDADNSGASKWLGLYCETHRTFLCNKGADCAEPPTKPERPATHVQHRLDEKTGGW